MPLFRPHLSSFWDWDMMLDRTRPTRLFDQNFGLALEDDQIFNTPATAPVAGAASVFPYLSSYRPRRLHSRQESGVSQVECNKDQFEVKLDVQQFTPEEITVKTIDTMVVIEGKHEEKQDEHGLISRHFVRKYVLPEDVKPETVMCHLSSDGVLSVTAPRVVQQEEKQAVKVVPIVQTGRPALVQRQCSMSGGGGQARSSSPACGSCTGNRGPQQQASDSGCGQGQGNGNTMRINITREDGK